MDETEHSVAFLDRPQGRIAFDVSGDGPLVLLVPGMGDLRSTYRHLTPALIAAGFRVATTDLRGHGDSDATFTTFGDAATGDDLVALLVELGQPGFLVGNSMGAGASVWAAAQRPDLVRGLVLLGPFVRDPATSALQRLALRVAMNPAWAATTWKAYLPRLYAGRRPADFDSHRAAIVASLRRPGHASALCKTSRISHAQTAARLPDVAAPALVVMGELDPDFDSPADEARWIADQLGAGIAMIPEAGHYPQSQRPDLTARAVIDFIHRVGADA